MFKHIIPQLLDIRPKTRRKRAPHSPLTRERIGDSVAGSWCDERRAHHSSMVVAAAARRAERERGPSGLGKLRPPSHLRTTEDLRRYETVKLPASYGRPLITELQRDFLRQWLTARGPDPDLCEDLIGEETWMGFFLHGWRTLRNVSHHSAETRTGLISRPGGAARVGEATVTFLVGPQRREWPVSISVVFKPSR